jgi:hypothetical protein
VAICIAHVTGSVTPALQRARTSILYLEVEVEVVRSEVMIIIKAGCIRRPGEHLRLPCWGCLNALSHPPGNEAMLNRCSAVVVSSPGLCGAVDAASVNSLHGRYKI